MKLFNILAGLILGSTMAVGVGAGVVANSENNVKEAVALNTNFSAGESIYFRLDGSFTASGGTCYINIQYADGSWPGVIHVDSTITAKDSATLYKYTFAKDAYLFGINRRNSTGTDNWGWSSTDITTHSNNLFNLYHHSNWDWDKQVEIVEQSASIVNVSLVQPVSGGTVEVKNNNGNQSGAGYYYSDWELLFTAKPNAGYFHDIWTDGSGTPWTGDNKNTNPVVINGLSGEFSVSCRFAAYTDQVWKILGNSSEPWDKDHQDIDITLPYKAGSAETSGAEYYTTNLQLVAGSLFKVVNMNVSPNVYYGYDDLESGEHSAKDTYVTFDSSRNIKVLTGGTYELYMKTSTGKIWMQISSESEAIAYGTEFLQNITCTNTSTTFNLNAWNKTGSETTSMEYKYEHLTSGARSYLASLIKDEEGNDAEKAVARYDRILSKYGYGTNPGDYHDFMGRKPQKLTANINSLVSDTSNNSIMMIIVASAIGLTVAGGYFFIRRRKHN